jgi:hypothetical protein
MYRFNSEGDLHMKPNPNQDEAARLERRAQVKAEIAQLEAEFAQAEQDLAAVDRRLGLDVDADALDKDAAHEMTRALDALRQVIQIRREELRVLEQGRPAQR